MEYPSTSLRVILRCKIKKNPGGVRHLFDVPDPSGESELLLGKLF